MGATAEDRSDTRLPDPFWLALRRWVEANSFTPTWLRPRWTYPLVGYAAAVLLQGLAVFATLLLLQLFPSLSFRSAPSIFVIVLVALGWGVGPSFFAALIGDALLNYVVVKPYFTWSVTTPSEWASLVLYLVAGLAIATVSSVAERNRREARQLAQSLATERARLESVIEAVPDILSLHDATGRIVRLNQAGRAVAPALGGSESLADAADAYGPRTPKGEAVPVEHLPVARALRGDVVTGQELRSLAPAGGDRYLAVSAAPLRDARGRVDGVVAIAHDVTERRRLERRTREALDALLAMARTLVLSPQESALEAEQGRAASRLVGQRLVDLTRHVLDCQRVGLAAFDLRSGVQHALAVAGLSPELERAWRDSVEGAPLTNPEAPTDPELMVRFTAGEVVIVYMTKPPFDDQPNPFGVHAALVAPLRVNGDIVGVLSLDYDGAAHDYTTDEIALAAAVAQLAALALERERLRGEREEARASALALRETNQRMDEFLSIASHELKTPLTSLRGNVQLALRHLRRLPVQRDAAEPDAAETSDQIAAMLQRAEEQITRQTRLIDDLLDLSRIQTGHMDLQIETHDLVALVRACTEEQSHAWPARAFTLEMPAGTVTVRADADRIGQVLTNYLTNALKYAPADRPVTVSLLVQEAEARVEVKDDGPGLTPEQQLHVWDRYRRIEGVAVQSDSQQVGGLGLGLYISRTIVEQHGGHVGVDSAPGQGATFWFTLPAEHNT